MAAVSANSGRQRLNFEGKTSRSPSGSVLAADGINPGSPSRSPLPGISRGAARVQPLAILGVSQIDPYHPKHWQAWKCGRSDQAGQDHPTLLCSE